MSQELSSSVDSRDDLDVNRVSISLRIHPTDLARWRTAAKAAGLTLTEWITRRCNGPTTIEAPPPALKPTKRRR